MANPTTFTNFITSVEEMFVSQSGTSPYIISSGTYDLGWYYDGRSIVNLSRDVMYKPGCRIDFSFNKNPKHWHNPSNETMYDCKVSINVAYKVDSEIQRNNLTSIKAQLWNDYHTIQKALTYPGNLMYTSASGTTGLISGFLVDANNKPTPTIDFKQKVAWIQFVFNSKVVLSNS
jgi:hypothetical protein